MRRILIILITLIPLLSITNSWAASSKSSIWVQPVVESNSNASNPMASKLSITRVDLDKKETRIYMHIQHYPNYWVLFAKDTYLKVGDQHYLVKSCEGLELGERFFLPAEGYADVVFHFAPLPKNTQKFDFIEGDGEGALRILGIQSVDTRAAQVFPSSWRNTTTGDWDIAFYDDFAIYDCHFWQYKDKKQKGNRYDFVLTDGKREIPVSMDKNKQGNRCITINGKKNEYAIITTFTLPDYPQKDELATIKDTHYIGDTATVIGWLKDMPQLFWNQGKEYGAIHEDLYLYGHQISNFVKLDSLGRFELKIPLLNSSEVLMDWKHTFISTVLEPGETYFLLYDFKNGTQMMMGKNSRLQNELLSHPIPRFDTQYQDMYKNTKTAQEHFDILTPRYTQVMEKVRELSQIYPTLSKRYQDYVSEYEKCNYAQALMQGWGFVKNYDFPKDKTAQVVKLWKEIKLPYTLYQSYDNLITDIVRQMVFDNYWLTYNGKRVLLNETYYPQLLELHQAKGDITISNQEIATVKLWLKGYKDYIVKTSQTNGKDLDKIAADFFNSDVSIKAQNILARKDIAKMLMEEKPLVDFYFERDIADSLNCNQDQHDIIIAKSFNRYMEGNFLPLSDKEVELVKQSIKGKAALESVMTNHQRLSEIMQRDISQYPSIKKMPQGISDGEQLLQKILEPYKGKMVLLDVWGTWCSPCKDGLSQSQEEYERLKPYDMVYVYLACHSPENSWKNIIKQYNLLGDNIAHYNLSESEAKAVLDYLNVHSFPSYRLFDKNGNLVDKPVDARRLDQLEQVIQALPK